MKISNKTSFLISTILILALSALYVLLIFIGFKGAIVNLNKVDKSNQSYYSQSKDGKIYYGNSLSSIQVPYVGYFRR